MIFETQGELINSLINNFLDVSFVEELPTFEGQFGYCIELLSHFLDPKSSVYKLEKHLKADPVGVYQHLLIQEGASKVISDLVENNSKYLARLGNEHVLNIDAATTAMEEVKQLIRVANVYLSRPSQDIYKFRVYPKGSNPQNRGAFAGHIDKASTVPLASMEQLDETMGSIRQIAQSNIDKVIKALPKNGKSKIALIGQKKSLINGLKFNTDAKIAKVESKDSNGNFVTLADFNDQLLNNRQSSKGTISLAPVIENEIVVHLESPSDASSTAIFDLTPLMIKYKGSGFISREKFSVKKPITTISLEADDHIPEIARQYFTSVHEIKLEGKEDWIKIRPRNLDNYESSLPEIILIGPEKEIKSFDNSALVGTYNVQSEIPILNFEYQASFKQKDSIPTQVLLDLYQKKAIREIEKLIVPASSVDPVNPFVSLPSFPLEKPKVFFLDEGIISEKPQDGVLIGNNSSFDTLSLPKSFVDIENKERLALAKGSQTLTQVKTNPGATEFAVDEKGFVILNSSSMSGEDVFASLLPERINVVPQAGPRAAYRFELEHNPGFVDGNLELFYKTYPESVIETFSFKTLKQAYSNVYRIPLKESGIKSYTIKALDENLNSVSTIFNTENTYKSGLENSANGEYSVDKEKGDIYFYLDTGKNLSISVSYKYSKTIDATSDIVPFLSPIAKKIFTTNKKFEFTTLTETVPKGTKEFVLGSSLDIWSEWQVVDSSVLINGFTNNPNVKNIQTVENVILKKDSNSSGISVFKLPLTPLDLSSEVSVSDPGSFVTSQNASGNGGWKVSGNNAIHINDSGNVLNYIVVSYTFKRTSQVDIKKHFAYHFQNREVVFEEKTTEDLIIKYNVQSYTARYSIATEIDSKTVSFKSNDRKSIQIKNSILAESDAKNNLLKINRKILVVYPKLKNDTENAFSSDVSNPSEYISVLPRHVDIEVGTS